ncbi:MAG: protein-tyrosine phosphatase family protein [Elsteraceae bacterium]
MFDRLAAPRGGFLLLSAHPASQGNLAAALADYRRAGAQLLLSLPPAAELEQLGLGALATECAALGLDWAHCPIPDFEPPGPPFEAAWRKAGPGLHARLDAGETIGLHCHAGLGRTGTVAALILIERGVTPVEAIAAVRRARPGAIETAAQLSYLHLKASS